MSATNGEPPVIRFRNYKPSAALLSTAAPAAKDDSVPARAARSDAAGDTAHEPASDAASLIRRGGRLDLPGGPTVEIVPRTSAPSVVLVQRLQEEQQAAAATASSETNEDVAATIAPRKPNWDLKRDIQSKLDYLEAQTQRAIAEMVRERVAAEASRAGATGTGGVESKSDFDTTTLVAAVMAAGEGETTAGDRKQTVGAEDINIDDI